jgi:hypothetical protein
LLYRREVDALVSAVDLKRQPVIAERLDRSSRPPSHRWASFRVSYSITTAVPLNDCRVIAITDGMSERARTVAHRL